MGTVAGPKPWRTDLRACVAAHDPGRLGEIEAPEGYRFWGWFLSGRRFAVMDCMRQKGWQDTPALAIL